jgi:hypothetical protein
MNSTELANPGVLWMYGTTALSQASPVAIEQSCMSEQRSGVIQT